MPIKHEWDGTILTITSDSGTSSADLKGDKGDTGARGARGLTGATGGGALIEDGVISSDTTWSSAGIMDRFAAQLATTGNPVTCNPIPDFPLHIITDIEPKQSGSGEPYPAGGGKNLIPTYDEQTTTINGITFTYNKDGSITANGTATATAVFQFSYNFELQAGSYLFSGCPAGGGMSTYSLRLVDGANINNDNMTSNPASVELTEESKKIRHIAVIIRTGYTANNLTFYPMLRKATETDATYQPYSNIRPISGMDAVKVGVLSGKNLCGNVNDIIVQNLPEKATATQSGNVITLKTEHYGDGFYFASGAMKKGTTYTITGNAVGHSNIRIYDITNTNEILGQTEAGNDGGFILIYTPTTDNAALRFWVNQGVECKITNLQIEEGTTATTYEPYNGNTFALSFGETVYSGSLDWNTGELVVYRKCVSFNGSENWTIQNTNMANIYRWGLDIPEAKFIDDSSKVANHISSHYKVVSANATFLRNNGISHTSDRTHIYDERYSTKTLADFKAYLAAQYNAGTPIQLCYELAEPYTIKLTPQEIKAIKGQNTLYTDAANINVLGRVDTMYQLYLLEERLAALEAAFIKG